MILFARVILMKHDLHPVYRFKVYYTVVNEIFLVHPFFGVKIILSKKPLYFLPA